MKSFVFIKALALWLLIVNGDLFSAAQDGYSKDIFNAVKADNLKVVREFLECRADVNQKDSSESSLLYYAVDKKNTEMAELLLGCGADINSSDDFGFSSPIHRAATTSNEEQVRFLLDKNADVNKRSLTSSLVPLECAVERGALKVVTLLLKRKANPNPGGYSYSLFRAVEKANLADKNSIPSANKIKIVELLVQAGADPYLPIPYQKDTPLSIANPRIGELIEAAIAKKKASDAAAGQSAAQEEKE